MNWRTRIRSIKKHATLSPGVRALLSFVVAGLANIFDFYPGYISLAAGVYAWWVGAHKNPPLRPVARLDKSRISGGDFTFFRFDDEAPKWMRWATANRDETGLVWEGFGLGVWIGEPFERAGMAPGRIVSIAVRLYGTNEGVGHFSYKCRSRGFNGFVGEGHFNMAPFEKEGSSWAFHVAQSAGYALGEDLKGLVRPLLVSYEGKEITIYDPESGRDVYFNIEKNSSLDDLFVFGPYPTKLPGVRYKHSPGMTASPVGLPGTPVDTAPYLSLHCLDVYGNPMTHVLIQVKSESGYEYAQSSHGDKITITVPRTIDSILVSVRRGGYAEVEDEFSLRGRFRLDLVVVMEPLRPLP